MGEWLEADGLGGFASGTVDGIRTRRYQAVLLPATSPPTGRGVLVNGFEAWLETPAGSVALTSQRYAPDVVHPDGASRIETFTPDPWPSWMLGLPDGNRIEHQVLVPRGQAATVLTWRLRAGPGGTLAVRPLVSGRDYHALHHENPAFRFDADVAGRRVVWRPYPGLPAIVARSNGSYAHQPDWYRNFLYTAEQARGLDCVEDLASPGIFRWDLARGEAVLILAAEGHEPADDAEAIRVAEGEHRHRFASRLHRAADAYVVRRGSGKTVIAGYPWFTDWGRDTLIALRGLCLATGRFDDARAILLEWSGAVSEGMLPNCFPDHGEAPEFNAVDAALWFVVAVHEFLETVPDVASHDRDALEAAIDAIVSGYARGTRYGIRADDDGLLAAGQPGLQLTWMDARVGDRVVTPRIGKPVEVQALWLNALHIAGGRSDRWSALAARGRESFAARFWNEAAGALHDVVDVDHRAGTVDATIRPNQIFAVGGLSFPSSRGRVPGASSIRSIAPAHPSRPPHARPGRARLHAALPWRRRRARRRVPSGHRVALADGCLRRSLGARPRWNGERAPRGARALPRYVVRAPR